MILLKLILFISFVSANTISKPSDLTTNGIKHCFPSKAITYRCNYEQDLQTKMWDSELEIKALEKDGLTHYYGYGKMIAPDVCHDHYNQIKKLISGTNKVCIYSELENHIGPAETFAKWRGMKTLRGSYFW